MIIHSFIYLLIHPLGCPDAAGGGSADSWDNLFIYLLIRPLGCPDAAGGGSADSWDPDPQHRHGHPGPHTQGRRRGTQNRDHGGHHRRLGMLGSQKHAWN